jgi:Domain of unknown function (DUF4268)
MFKIDRNSNSITPLQMATFGELGYRERAHLQEWIAKNPSCLGEDLLIIQKEFSGFNETNERLDLLAIDKQGSLVIIENKLDDTGRDVTWQALKYASYCSSLSKEVISRIYQEYLDRNNHQEDAKKLLTEFLEEDDYEDIVINKGVTQRIILIAANFRREVTSTVLWLLNYKMRVQCFRVTPYSNADEQFLTIEQIIPTKDVEEFMIGIAEKALDEAEGAVEEAQRHRVRREFWNALLQESAEKTPLFNNITAGTQSWIGAGSGVRGVAYNFFAGKRYARTELYIDRGDREQNKYIYDQLFSIKDQIEARFNGSLIWERMDEKQASRIKCESNGNIYNRDQWPSMIEFMIDSMIRLEKAFKEPLANINRNLRTRTDA